MTLLRVGSGLLRQIIELRRKKEAFIDIQNQEQIEEEFYSLIAKKFPEYANGVLIGIGIDYARNTVYGTYLHNNFPRKTEPNINPPRWLLSHRCKECTGAIEEGSQYLFEYTEDRHDIEIVCEKCREARPDAVIG
jgi:hypothetical protein